MPTNIFELLAYDSQWHILTFLCLNDLYRVSLASQHGSYLVLSAEADICLWKLMAHRLGFCTEETVLVPWNNVRVWRELVRSSMIKWDTKARSPDSTIQLHNENRTISGDRRWIKWDTIRTNRKLGMGLVHCWEYTLDVLDTGQYNSHQIFVGIEPSTFAFTEVRNDRIIGLHSSGIGYSIGENSIYVGHKREAVDISLCEDYQTGDKIAIKLDLKNLGNSRTASMYLFKNDEYFHTIADIPTQGILYYPAISVIGPHTVSIRTKHPYSLRANKNSKHFFRCLMFVPVTFFGSFLVEQWNS